MTWRVGTKLGRTLYRDEALVGMVDSPEIAAAIVEAMNEREEYAARGLLRAYDVYDSSDGVCRHCKVRVEWVGWCKFCWRRPL